MSKSKFSLSSHHPHFSSERIRDDVEKNRQRVKELGPGIITGSAGDDPAGIITYTAVGASTGFSLLWLMLISTPMLIAVQDMAARIATITGKSLPEVIKAFYSRKLSIIMVSCLAVTNIITIGADLQGFAEILSLLTGIKAVYYIIPITALIAYLVMFHSYKKIKKILIGFAFVLSAYVISAIMAKPDWGKVVVDTFVPSFSSSSAYLLAALGLLGTTISPYLLFWQASEEKEEHKTVAQSKSVEWDTAIGMFYSNLIAFCIIVASAVMLFGTHGTINTIKDAALALKPLGSQNAYILFSIGIISAGLLAIPVLAGSTAYAVADSFGWREGLDNKISDAKGFYTIFFGALLVSNFIYLTPYSSVQILYYSQILNGILLPVLVGILLILNNNKKIVGDFKNPLFNNILGWLTLIISIVFAVWLFL